MDIQKKRTFIINFLYFAILALLVYALLEYALPMVMPFLLAFLIAYLLRRPTRYVAGKLGIGRKPVAILMVLLFYSTIGLLLSLMGVKLFTLVKALVLFLPNFYTGRVEPALVAAFDGLAQAFSRMDPALVYALDELSRQLVQSLGQLVSSLSMGAVSAVSGYATSLPGLLVKLLLMVISSFFIAADYELMTGFVLRQFTGRVRELLFRIKEYLVGTLFVCVRSYALIMCITFVELSVGLSLLRIENAILIAFGIAIFDILPVLGTGGIMLPWTLVTALRGNVPLALGLLAVYLVVTVVRNILEPKIVGGQIGLHPVVTLVCMFVGTQLFGVLGLFGLPIAMSLLLHLNRTGTIRLFQ